MKLLFCGLVVFVNLMNGAAAAKDNTMSDPTLAIVQVSAPGSLTVEISNSSQEPIRIWNESNSWGAARWRVLLIRKGRLETFFENPDQSFTRNIPTFTEMPAGAHLEHKVDLSVGNWRGSDRHKIGFERGDIIIVIYDVPKEYGWAGAAVTMEASKMGVWYGVATALTTVQ